MHTNSLKYKSFFYSLAIHLVLGIIALSVYLKDDDEHEVYSLINLKSMQICTPDIAEPLIKKSLKTQAQKQPKLKKEFKKPKQKTTKAIMPPALVKKIVPLKPKAMEEVILIKTEIIKTTEKLEVEEETEDKIEEEVETQEELIAKDETIVLEESTPLVAVIEPKISYEAQYIQDNFALIGALIKKNLFYSRSAKNRELQGKVMISFTLSIQGEVIDIEALGAFHYSLKKLAIKTLRKASKSFPHPREALALRIPIVYKLH